MPKITAALQDYQSSPRSPLLNTAPASWRPDCVYVRIPITAGTVASRMSGESGAVTICVTMTIRCRGGRQQTVSPDGAEWSPPTPRVDKSFCEGGAWAFRRLRMLETGRFETITALAAAEKINASYVSRILRLTLLAPEVVEVILDGRQPEVMALPGLLVGVEVEWPDQRLRFR